METGSVVAEHMRPLLVKLKQFITVINISSCCINVEADGNISIWILADGLMFGVEMLNSSHQRQIFTELLKNNM